MVQRDQQNKKRGRQDSYPRSSTREDVGISTRSQRPTDTTNSRPKGEDSLTMFKSVGNILNRVSDKVTSIGKASSSTSHPPQRDQGSDRLSYRGDNGPQARRQLQHESVEHRDTEDGVNIISVKPEEDTNMDDAPDPTVPGAYRGAKATPDHSRDGSNISTYAQSSRHSRHGDDKNLPLEKATEDRRLERDLEDLRETNRILLEKLKCANAESVEKQDAMQAEIDQLRKQNNAQEQHYNVLKGNYDKVRHTNTEQAKRSKAANAHIEHLVAQLKEFEGWNAQQKSKVASLEEEKAIYQLQIEKMSQIVSQLNRKGLPLPPDDTYFIQELASLTSDIRQWARLFTRGRPALTIEEMDAIESKLPDAMKYYLKDSFLDLRGLLESTSVGTKLRTRCVEAILLRSLMGSYLHERYIGMDDMTYATIGKIRQSLHASNEEVQYWTALTSHLLGKNSDVLAIQQESEINQITEDLYKDLAVFNEGASNTRATKPALKNIVSRVAKLGMEIAQLPFCITPRMYKPGSRFILERMDDIDANPDVEGDPGSEIKTSIVFTPMWLKIVFDEEGKAINDSNQRILLSKALVSCLT